LRKHGHAAIFSPAEVVASLTAKSTVLAPDAVILIYQPFLLDEPRARGVQPATGYPAPWGSLWKPQSGYSTQRSMRSSGNSPPHDNSRFVACPSAA
jgi:hypothetical protein